MCNSKTIQIFPNQYVDLLRFLFTEDSLKIKKFLELVFRSYFSYNFLIKMFLLQCYIKRPHFITRLYLLLKLFIKMCSRFMLRHLRCHDILISQKLKFDHLKNEKSFRSELKNILPCFTSALL